MCAVVEIDLRQPSMLHGKKGFDRIVYAFKNVLTTPVTWLFANLDTEGILVVLILFFSHTHVVQQSSQTL
jgi:hypothetical protein